MTEIPQDPTIVMGASKEPPVNRSGYIENLEGNAPVESDNFKKVERAWGATQARIDGDDGRDIDGNPVIPALYQELVFAQQGLDPERMLVMNAGHMEPLTRKIDMNGSEAIDAVRNPLYLVNMNLPTALSNGELGYICLSVEVAYNDFSRPLDEFMRTEVPAACARRLRQYSDVIAKQHERYIQFRGYPEKDGKLQPLNLTGFSYQSLKPEQTNEWTGIAKPIRQLFVAAVDRNVANKERALAEREARRAQEEAAMLAAKAAEEARKKIVLLSEDDL